MESLPNDVLRYILQFVPFEEKNWLNVVMTSKHLGYVGSRYFRKRLDNANASIFVTGGTDEESSTDTIEKFDIITQSWSTVPAKMRLLRTGHAVVSYREFVYIFGGRDDHAYNSVERFDTHRNEWKAMAPLTSNRTILSAARYRDNIFVLGGSNGFNAVDIVEQTKITEGDRCIDFDWQLRSPMKVARSGLGSAILGDGLFVAGGSNNNSPLSSVERYDIETDKWSQIADMLVPRSGLGVTNLDTNTLLALGGWSDNEKLKTVEMYDSRENKWRPMASMKTVKSALRAVTVGSYVYAIGGYDGEKPLSVVERYDPRMDVWETVGELKHAKYSFGVGVVNVNV